MRFAPHALGLAVATLLAAAGERAGRAAEPSPAAPAAAGASPDAGSGPRLSAERVVFSTSAGDIVFAFYPEVAPRHTAQLLKLIRLGVYDGTRFHRVHPGFVAQVSSAQDRRTALTPEQRTAITKIPAELSPLHHRRGVLSMAHGDDPDSAETSFSFLLGDAPHLDGKYTIFGEVVGGLDVLDRLAEVPAQPPAYAPVVKLRVKRALALEDAALLSELTLAPARAVPVPPPAAVAPSSETEPAGSASAAAPVAPAPPAPLAIILGAIVLLGLAQPLLARRFEARRLLSLGLLSALLGALALLVQLSTAGVPEAHRPLAGLVGFFGLVGLFRVLGRFES